MFLVFHFKAFAILHSQNQHITIPKQYRDSIKKSVCILNLKNLENSIFPKVLIVHGNKLSLSTSMKEVSGPNTRQSYFYITRSITNLLANSKATQMTDFSPLQNNEPHQSASLRNTPHKRVLGRQGTYHVGLGHDGVHQGCDWDCPGRYCSGDSQPPHSLTTRRPLSAELGVFGTPGCLRSSPAPGRRTRPQSPRDRPRYGEAGVRYLWNHLGSSFPRATTPRLAD